MVDRAKKSRVASLFALLAISSTVLGVPLIHPVLHDHVVHDCHLAGRLGKPLLSAVESGGDIDCHICDSLAAAHFFLNVPSCYTTIDGPPRNLDPWNHAVPINAYQNQEKSRAPPLYDRVS